MKNELWKEQGARLRAERLFRGITQEEMAEMLNKSERHYRRYEAGDVKLTVDVAIVIRVCKIDLEYILYGQVKTDFEIERGMKIMPEDMYQQIVGEITVLEEIMRGGFNLDKCLKRIVDRLKLFISYYRDNMFAPELREVKRFMAFTDLHEEFHLDQYLSPDYKRHFKKANEDLIGYIEELAGKFSE